MALFKKNNPDEILDKPDDERVTEMMGWVESLRESRSRYEQKCYINDAFMDGEHFMGFNRATGRLEREKAPVGVANRIIQKGYRKMVDMKGTITADDPVWMAHPGPSPDGTFSPETLKNTTKINDFLASVFTRKKVAKKMKDAVYEATYHPYSVVWVSYDETEDEFSFDRKDFYDVLIEPDVDDVEDSSVVVIQFVREKQDLADSPSYKNTSDVEISKRWAASDWKNDRMEDKFSQLPTYKKPVICSEIWKKVTVSADVRKRVLKNDPEATWISDTEPAEAGEEAEYLIRDGQKIMYVCTIAGGKIVREAWAPYHQYPCAVYHIPDGTLLQPAPVERIISANKSLDVQVTRQEQYVNEVAVGRLKRHKSTKIHKVSNVHGSEYVWDGLPELEPKFEAIPSLPATVITVQNNTERYIDEGSVHSGGAAQVAAGGGGRGAKLIESIKSLDVQSLSPARDNYAYTHEKLASVVLMLSDFHLDHPRDVTRSISPDKHQAFQVIGGRAADSQLSQMAYGSPDDQAPANLSLSPAVPQAGQTPSTPGMPVAAPMMPDTTRDGTVRPVVLRANQQVTVSIEPGAAYTQQAKQDLLMNLASMGALSVQSLLTLLKVSGNVSEELRQLMEEQGKSLIYSDDFKELSPQTQQQVITELQGLNISMPLSPRPIGSVKKSASNGMLNG